LETLVEDHASLDLDFAALIDLILASELETARESLGAFTIVLVEHEQREEDLLRDAIET